MLAYIFPGQGSQFSGMGKELYERSALAKELFEKANEILGFRITDSMFFGTEEELRETRVTQPAVFLYSVVDCLCAMSEGAPVPQMVAGHSLGEYSALVIAGVLSFEDGLRLVAARANAMQKACSLVPSTMAAVLRADSSLVEEACKRVSSSGLEEDVVVPANYNSPVQTVISGTLSGVEKATAVLHEMGVRRVVPLNVGGAFHSPLMQPAAEELQQAILGTSFNAPKCAVYQNVDGSPSVAPERIQQNLIAQLTASVRWKQSILQMQSDGMSHFREFGPGEVCSGLMARIAPDVLPMA